MLLQTFDRASRGDHDGPHFLIPLLLLVLLGFVVATIVRRRRGHGHHRHGYGHGSPISTLEHRFAVGEIDRDEFEHRKAVLDGSDNVPPAPARSAPVAVKEEPATTAVESEDLPDSQLGNDE